MIEYCVVILIILSYSYYEYISSNANPNKVPGKLVANFNA